MTETIPDPEPITRPLWRLSRPERKKALEPFIGRQIRVERWFSRVAALGDATYQGTLLAVATSTLGTSADLLIIHTVEGNIWAVSAAQVAHVMVAPRPRR